MEYKVEKILHSGTIYKRYETRILGGYAFRKGCVVELDPGCITIGIPLVISYLRKDNGSDYSGHYFIISTVKNVIWFKEKKYDIVIIETQNSIYIFQKAINIRERILELTGIDIINDDGKYKSLYDILSELSILWEKLTEDNKKKIIGRLIKK